MHILIKALLTLCDINDIMISVVKEEHSISIVGFSSGTY